ncbi:Isochorismatase-like protein [Umbelopsis sp. PMI_123]|nr:Isochorismatase-like protein [Umbelopsis sp. PMI_123]
MLDKTALILVDIQNDFMETGSLPVSEASEILPVVNQLVNAIKQRGGLIVATKDWHPQNHVSFASNTPNAKVFETVTMEYEGEKFGQVLWPDHCVQNSKGSEFTDGLVTSNIDITVFKGANPFVDSYSAFADNKYFEITELAKHLFTRHIDTVIVVGLAADYCVKETALDARKFGFRTVLVKEGTKGVIPTNFDSCMDELVAKGVQVTSINNQDFTSEFLT